MKKDSLIFTNDNCVGCNKCIKSCPAIGANTAIGDTKHSRILIDGSKCVHCGTCLKNCEHEARGFNDDLEDVFDGLKRGEKIVLMVAPSFFLSYPEESPFIISYLRSLGFIAIYNVSFGANITTWASIKYMQITGRTGLISSACPAIVSYIEKYKPDLITRLMPVMSPVGCLQTYLRNKIYKDYAEDIKYAFLCPCIAKHDEYTTYPGGYVLDYTFTYKSMYEYVKKNPIPLKSFGKSKCDKLGMEGLGLFYPIPGGMRMSLKNYSKKQLFVKQVEGSNRTFRYLDTFSKMLENGDALPDFVDILNCEGGCNEGVATNMSSEEAEVLMTRLHDDYLVIQNEAAPSRSADRKSERWNYLDEYMDMEEGLDYRMFLRQFNHLATVREKKISEEAINEIFMGMNKESEADRTINCTSCGYKSCREMAKAIYYGYNKPENCVHYVKNELISNKEQLEQILTAVTGGSDNVGLHLVKSEQLVSHIRDSLLEVEKQREEIQNSTHVRTQLFASLTHELRTPLNAIMNMTDMMDKTNMSDKQLANLKSIQTAGNGLMDTINEILDFSKAEAGKMTIVEDEYFLHDLLGEVVTIASFRCMEKKIELKRKLDPTTPDRLTGDMKRIRQVIINIVGNAIKYTKLGSVTMDAGWNGDVQNPELILSVVDTGIGIKEEDIPFLFDAFKQVNEKENKHIVGTGLGLSISKSISDAMGGRIEVESKYGVGSKFTFYVPQKITVYEPISQTLAKLGSKGLDGQRKHSFYVPSYNVLVVDDFQVNLHIARTFLDKYLIYVDVAESGPEAIRKCADKKYDLIFMDHNMPDMSGLEATSIIKESQTVNKDTPVIYMSAMDEDQMAENNTEGVFAGFLEKPLKKDCLDEVLLKLVRPEAISLDENGFVPDDGEIIRLINNRREKALLSIIAGMEIYSIKNNSDDVTRRVKKFRLMLQQGYGEEVYEQKDVILEQCHILRGEKNDDV